MPELGAALLPELLLVPVVLSLVPLGAVELPLPVAVPVPTVELSLFDLSPILDVDHELLVPELPVLPESLR